MIKRFVLILCVALLFASCASAEDLIGNWAYIHAPEEAAFILKDDGKATLDGESFFYEIDGGFFVMTDRSGDVRRMRYVMDGENMLLYKTAEYVCQDSDAPGSIIGVWKDDKTNWSYQFTDKGTFLEDGYFPGYYSVNEAEKSFKLVYLDQFTDTVCYYEIEGNRLTVEYPWTMVRVK